MHQQLSLCSNILCSAHFDVQYKWIQWAVQYSACCKLHHVINVTNHFYWSVITASKVYVTVSENIYQVASNTIMNFSHLKAR